MFGSSWGFTRGPKKAEQQQQPPPPISRRYSLPPSISQEPGGRNNNSNNNNSTYCPGDESFDIGNNSTIYLSKKELGEFGKLGLGKRGEEQGKQLAGSKVEIYDKEEEEEEDDEYDQRSLTLTVSPPSTTTSSVNTESHLFWINCLKENGVLDVSMSGGAATSCGASNNSPAHLRYLASIRSPIGRDYNNTFNNKKEGIFATLRRNTSEMLLQMNETETEIGSILSSQLSYSPSSIGGISVAAVEYTTTTLRGQGCYLTECIQAPSYDDDDHDDNNHDHVLDICRPPSEDSSHMAIKPLPSDITLKTKITAGTEESYDDYYTTEGDKKISHSGSISTNPSPCSLVDEQLSNARVKQQVPFTEKTTRDGIQCERVDVMDRDDGKHDDQHSNRNEPEIDKDVDVMDRSDDIEEDQLPDKIGDMMSSASAVKVDDGDAHVADFEAENNKDKSLVMEEPPENEYEWAYNVWKSKGLMKTTSPRFEYVKNRRKSGGGKIIKRKSTGGGSCNGSANKNIDLYKQTLEPPGEELIDPESLVTPTDSEVTFGFQDVVEEETRETASLPGPRRGERLSFPLTTRPSVKKLHDGKSFANVMQMWKQKSDDKPNSHFLSPEQNIPASDYKVLSAEQKRAAAVKIQFDRKEDATAKTKYHNNNNNKATQHTALVSVASMVSTVSSQLTSATSYEVDHPLKLNESDCQSVFSNRSFMSDSSRDGTESGSVTLRYLRPNKDVTEQPAQRRSPPVRGTSIDEQLMMPLPRRMSSGGRSKSRRVSHSQRRRRLSDPMMPPRRGQAEESSDFTKATSPRDHFRRNKSPPKSRGDYKTIVQSFLGHVNDQRDDTSNSTSNTPPRAPRTNCSQMPPLPEANGGMEDVKLESTQSATSSMDTYQQLQQRCFQEISQNQSCESSSSFGGNSFSWRFDSLSQNQSSESAFENNKFPFALDIVNEQFHESPTQRTEAAIRAIRLNRGRCRGPAILEESGEDSGFGAETNISREAIKKSPKPPLPSSRITPRAVHADMKSTPASISAPDDSPWTKHILKNLEEAQTDEMHIESPREDSKERPWRSDLVYERACHIGDQAIMSESNSNGTCNCASSVFSGNDELIEFFLPQMGMACTCGRRPSGLVNTAEPTALENILRSWQVVFLAGFGIHRGDQLVKAHHRSANALASALRQYRRKEDMTPFRTKSCGMALQIWSKTCKAYVRSIRKQLTSGTTEIKVPNTLYILSSFLERMQDQTQGTAQTPPQTGGRSDEEAEI